MSTKNEKIKLDTYFGIEWESFKSIVKQCGFKAAYKKEFVNRKLRLKVGSTPSTEEEIIYFNENPQRPWTNRRGIQCFAKLCSFFLQ